ncbi:MAG: hypothetical protein KGJ43_03595 [Acidobacteriota bacterium]|nr:hypothetical protein [Acidobacteriota bacterium]
MYFEPGSAFAQASGRAGTTGQLSHLGVSALRVVLSWADVAPRPNSPNRPAFEAENPASYDWGVLGEELEEAKRLHWPVLLTVASPVPKWASANHRDHLTRPNDRYFREFMTAVGRRFAPYVSLWAIWNEPNQVGWLQPQFNRNGTPASPAIYRGLFLAGYSGLQAAGIGAPRVLMGETAPFGNTLINTRTEGFLHNVSPLAFLRGALCLNGRYQRAAGCAPLPAYGFGHHAYTNSQGPGYVPSNPDEVTIGSLGRLVSALNRAAAAHAIRPGLPIYLTEFGINTRPNSLGVSPSAQAQQDAIAEHLAWENPRVAAFSQYALLDDAIPRHHPRGWIGFQTGLETATGRPKPLYYSWPLPLVVRREAHGYYIWGHVRPAHSATSVQLYVQARPGRPFRLLSTVRTGPLGYWVLRSSVAGAQWRVRWVGPGHTVYEGPPIAAS